MNILDSQELDRHVHLFSEPDKYQCSEVKVFRMHVGVVLEGLPELLRGIVLEILELQPGITVSRLDRAEPVGLLAAVEAQRLEALVVSDGAAARLGPGLALFAAHPRLRLLEIGADGRSAVLHAAGRRCRLEDLSPEQIVAELTAADAGGEAP